MEMTISKSALDDLRATVARLEAELEKKKLAAEVNYDTATRLEAENAALKGKVERLMEAVFLAQASLRWCGGSADFNEGGQALVGWIRGPQKALAVIDAALAEGEKGIT
jgi:hypothetical protein